MLPQTVAGAALIFIFTPPFPSPRFPRRLCFCTSIVPPRHLAHNEIKVQVSYNLAGLQPIKEGSALWRSGRLPSSPLYHARPRQAARRVFLILLVILVLLGFLTASKARIFKGFSEGAAVRYPPICGVSPPFLRCVTPLSAVRYPPFFRSFLTVLNFWRGRKAPRLQALRGARVPRSPPFRFGRSLFLNSL